MVTTFAVKRIISGTLLLGASLGCSGTQNSAGQMTCGEKDTWVVFDPQLDEKGAHTIVVSSDGPTGTCEFEIGDRVTPLDGRCDGPSVDLRIPSYTPPDSTQSGPDNLLPSVEGVWLFGEVDEVTVEVDGTSYGPLKTEHVDEMGQVCAHNEATAHLD